MTAIAISGANGTLGALIAKHLIALRATVHLIVRDASKLSEDLRANPNVKVFATPDILDTDPLRNAVRGTSAVVCALWADNKTMVSAQKALIDACIAENVPRYIASDYSIDWTRLSLGDIPPKDPCIMIYNYLRGRTDIKGVHILTGAFSDLIVSSGEMGVDMGKNGLHYFGTGDEKWDWTTYDDSANFIAHIALDPEANGVVKVRGDRKSMKEVASIIGKATGSQPETIYMGTNEELKSLMDKSKEEYKEREMPFDQAKL